MRFETTVVTISAVGDGRVSSPTFWHFPQLATTKSRRKWFWRENSKIPVHIWKLLNITATAIAVANRGICNGKFSSQFPSLFAVTNMVVMAHCRRQKQRPCPQRRREKCSHHAVAVGLLRRQNDFWANWINFYSEAWLLCQDTMGTSCEWRCGYRRSFA